MITIETIDEAAPLVEDALGRGCWLDRDLGWVTCPSVFKPGVWSRSATNVEHGRFLVVESDSLTKDQSASLFRWLKNYVGLHLVAVVDTAGKSLHGWFQRPGADLLNRLKIILPTLGCDRAMFYPSQVCRLPGALREGDYQRLLYLDT